MTTSLRLGTRASPLALWQANHVADRLRPHAGRAVELVLIETTGDVVRDRALSQIGGDGLFTKEIQKALLAGAVDVAVHSLKDLPTLPVAGLTLAAVPQRGPVGDVLVSVRHAGFDALPAGATVATSSLRRRAQALHRRPDLRLVNVRGNVQTRLRKLEEEGLDALLLAEAGLRRLGLDAHITEVLDREWMLPAVGQGALGLECRTKDEATRALLAELDDPATHACVRAERALLRGLGGGCLVPLGALAEVEGETLRLRAAVLPADGTRRIAGAVSGPAAEAEAEALGLRLAGVMREQGAAEVLGM
jgi:hydroxymethylbilane synthase